MKKILGLVAFVGLAFLAWAKFGDRVVGTEGGAAGDSEEAEVYVVESGHVAAVLKETGTIRARETVAVKSKVPGRVRSVSVAEGDRVEQGQVVAILEPDAQVALNLSQKRMEVRRLWLELSQRERNWWRQERLNGEGLTSAMVAEETERDWRLAETLYLQAKASLNLLEREANQPETKDAEELLGESSAISHFRILAPTKGVVSRVAVEPGELATSGTSSLDPKGALLMEIVDESVLQVSVDVNQIDVSKLAEGMTAELSLPSRSEETFPARVMRIAIVPNSEVTQLVVYPVTLELEERPDGLRLGMSVDVNLTLASADDVLRIPVLAFAEKESTTLVRVKVGLATFEDREVTIGVRGDQYVEVSHGLEAKDLILARHPDA